MSQDLVSQDLVSIVVPVYNGAAFIPRAVESALGQTHQPVEVLLIDDGSTDGSAEVADEAARQYERVRVVHQPNQGLSAARNTGIRHARGAYLNFLDVDDWLLPHKLEHQLNALRDHPEADLVYSDYRKVDERAGTTVDIVRGVPPVPFEELFVYRNWFAPMVPLLRRRLVETVGPFDADFRASEDRDYWLRCSRVTPFVYAPGIVAMYRLHGAQMHRDRARMAAAHARLIEKHFGSDRRRRRSALAFQHLEEAKYHWGKRRPLSCAWYLGRFLLSANSLSEARLVWTMPR